MRNLFYRCASAAISVFTIGLMFLFSSNSAYASSTPQNTHKLASHCVASIDPIQKGQKSSKVHSVNCYKTFQEAIEVATGGRVHLASNIRSKDVTPSMLQPSSSANRSNSYTPNTTHVISMIYDDSDWNSWDGEWTITTTGAPCSSTITYGFTSLSQYGWNDRISSVDDFDHCNDSVLWENNGYVGANVACYSCTYVGDAMNDRTSSIYWRVN